MGEAALKLAADGSAPPVWRNHIPVWIHQDPHFGRLRPQLRQTLQTIADRCDRPEPDGSLTGAFGGRRLIQMIGLSRSTFWRHLIRLERLGYVVTLSRGAALNGRNYGNVYGVPGSRGGLDHRRCRREWRRIVRDESGVHREVIGRGDQPGFRPGDVDKLSETTPQCVDNLSVKPPKSETGVVSKRDGGSVNLRRHHPPYGFSPKTHGAWKAKRTGGRTRMRHVEPADLIQTGRLLDLYADTARRGLIADGEAGRLRFVAAAEYAKRTSRDPDPRGWFAHIVNRGKWLFIANIDEDAANQKLREHAHGPRQDDDWAESAPDTRRAVPSLTADAKAVQAVQGFFASSGRSGDPFAAMRQQRPDWTRQRWDAAIAELEGKA